MIWVSFLLSVFLSVFLSFFSPFHHLFEWTNLCLNQNLHLISEGFTEAMNKPGPQRPSVVRGGTCHQRRYYVSDVSERARASLDCRTSTGVSGQDATMKGNLLSSPHGRLLHLLFADSLLHPVSLNVCVSKVRFAPRRMLLVASSQHDQGEACLQPRQHLTSQMACFALRPCWPSFLIWESWFVWRQRAASAPTGHRQTPWRNTCYCLSLNAKKKKNTLVAWWWYYCPVLP